MLERLKKLEGSGLTPLPPPPVTAPAARPSFGPDRPGSALPDSGPQRFPPPPPMPQGAGPGAGMPPPPGGVPSTPTPTGIALFGVLVGLGAAFTGLGGGFLMVPLLLYAGFTPQRAVGTSFLGILAISISAVFAHGKLANVDYRIGMALGVGGIIGAQIGARLLQNVSSGAFNKIFAIILVGLAAWLFVKK